MARVSYRRARRQNPGRFRLFKPRWHDPFPGIPGTEPEKRIFEMLVRMKIYFIYQGQVPEFEKGGVMYQLAPVEYKPDFVLPEYRLIIDPFSPFHHSQAESVARDVRKVAAYNMAGYAYYHPWALAEGRFTWDQYHNTSKAIVTRDRAGRPTARIKLYQGVNAQKNSYRGLNRKLTGTMTTYEMLSSIPEIKMGPRYALKDPRDVKAKAKDGYRIGKYLGAGASSVGAANRARRRGTPPLTFRVRR